MIPFDLNLKRTSGPVHASRAGWISGGNPESWLQEVLSWNVDQPGLMFLVVPDGDGEAQGVLVVFPPGSTPHGPMRALPYGCLVGRLYLPVDAVIRPAVSEAELASALDHPTQILHPSLGLIAFESRQIQRIHQLLALPPVRAIEWDQARRGPSSAPRLSRVVADETRQATTVEEVLQEGREEIGTHSLDDLPPEPAESPASVAEDAAHTARSGFLKALEWISGKGSSSSRSQSWIDGVNKWSKAQLSALNAARRREIERLLHLLEKDPDRGLGFAVPVHGEPGRGVAEPSGELSPHETDFNLGRLGGGRPVETWDSGPNLRQQLVEAYHRAATRALTEGRFRRAAYILAELLGDYSGAAAALERGCHYREAAILYRDHLGNNVRAARCLEDGGLLLEAIPLYEQEQMFLRAGDLYQTLEQPDPARKSYRSAVDLHLEKGDVLAAADLIEDRIEAPDEALELLATAWPRSPQAQACLDRRFQLLGQLGRHREARQLVHDLPRDAVELKLAVLLCGSLATVSDDYPDQGVRERARDSTRVVAGDWLEKTLNDPSSRDSVESLVRSVVSLVPSDRLLSRDGTRYLARLWEKPSPTPLPVRKQKTGTSSEPLLLGEFQLLEGEPVRWLAAQAAGDAYYAVGATAGGRAMLVRASWDGLIQPLGWTSAMESEKPPLLAAPRFGNHPVVVVPRWGRRLGMTRFPYTDSFKETPEAGSPSWLPPRMDAVCYNENDVIWALSRGEDLDRRLSAHTASGELISSRAVDLSQAAVPPAYRDDLEWEDLPMGLVARQGYVFLAAGFQVIQFFHRDQVRPIGLPDIARGMTLSGPFTRLRLAVLHDEGGTVLWPSSIGNKNFQRPFGDKLARPRAAFIRDGSLVAVNRSEGRLYDTNGRAVTFRAAFEGPGSEPVQVLPGLHLHQFAIITTDGRVRIYRIPA